MCLYLRYKEECVATSNIYVWKALINYGRLGCYSPIFNYRYNIGETYTSYLDRNKNSVSVDIGLHSFGYNIKISFFIVCVLFFDICEYRGYSLCTRICHFYGLLQILLCSISIL